MKRYIKISRNIFFILLGVVSIIFAVIGTQTGDKMNYIFAGICLALFSLIG